MTPISSLPAPALVDLSRDERPHTGLPWEIWWVTAHVRHGDQQLAAHMMYTHLGGGQMRVTATVTDIDRELERTKRTVVEVAIDPHQLSLATDTGTFDGSFSEGYRLRASVDHDTGFDLKLTATTPVLYAAGAGQFTLGELPTTQYSVGGLEAEGTVRLDGADLEVRGSAWYDRQWIDTGQLSDIGGAFTWLGMALDNGDTVSLWDTSMRPGGGRTWATIVHPDGTHVVTAAELVAATSTGSVKTAQGHEIPRGWRVVIPYLDADLEVTQRLVQDAPGFFFYTGALDVNGECDGLGVTGHGFCDLVGWTE